MCSNCDIARTYPEYQLFDPACLWCGVRIIQRATSFQLAASVVSARRTENLRIWVEQGHSEAEIRALVKGPLALAPTGQGVSTASESPTRQKPRSAGRK